MSSHGYRTTTVEYYEYMMPEQYGYESIPWPYQPNISTTYMARPHSNQLMGALGLAQSRTQHNGFFYEVAQFVPLQTVFEYEEEGHDESEQPPEQNEPVHELIREPEEEPIYRSNALPNIECDNQEQEQVNADINSDYEIKTTTETSTSEPRVKKKHIYQAEQGYIVEEPSSESSEEDHEGHTS